MTCVFVFETEPMTVAPSHTTMKNFHPRYRPLSQPLSSLYNEPPESNLLYAPCLISIIIILFIVEGIFPIYCFSFPSVLGTESQNWVAARRAGTLA